MEKQTGFKSGKEYVTLLTYMQSTSYEMLGWVKHKQESRLLGEISMISDTEKTSALWQKVKRN